MRRDPVTDTVLYVVQSNGERHPVLSVAVNDQDGAIKLNAKKLELTLAASSSGAPHPTFEVVTGHGGKEKANG